MLFSTLCDAISRYSNDDASLILRIIARPGLPKWIPLSTHSSNSSNGASSISSNGAVNGCFRYETAARSFRPLPLVEQRLAYSSGSSVSDGDSGGADGIHGGYIYTTSYAIPATADAVTVDAVKLRKQLLSVSNKPR